MAVVAAVSLAGCSADDVQFNGKIFDAVGLGGNQTKSAEPKLAARAPLVVPPTLDRLPEPGTPADATAAITALNDPDAQAKYSRAQLEKQQAEFCYKNYEQPKAHGDDSVDAVEGPLGPCRGSALTALKNLNKSEDE